MSLLNSDVLFLIIEELRDDKNSLYSCLSVNRTWCVTTVPILWRNPGQYSLTKDSENILFCTTILHLSEESRDILKNQGMDNLITETHWRPLFNYISCWKYLDLSFLEYVDSLKIIGKFNVPILKNELLKLFIKNTKLIHLSIPQNFDYQLHLISGADCCFSELECLNCGDNIAQDILEGLARICKSIKKMNLFIFDYASTNNCGLFKLIEMQKNLNDFNLFNIHHSFSANENKSFYKSLEESLIKHADTIQYLRIDWDLTTKFLSYFVNLLYLEIKKPYSINWNDPNYLKNLPLPNLKILRVYCAPLKILVNLIENTTENISEISMHCNNVHHDNCELLKAIYQNCPNIKYLKLSLHSVNLLTSEFESLLINCQFLNELSIKIYDDINEFNWGKLFFILAKSAPISLFNFKFYFRTFKLEDFKLFFDNWKNRRPMLLKIKHSRDESDQQLVDLVEQYRAKGIIKKWTLHYELVVFG
ncbi:hypothetical protein RclHR1_06210010 [Rhizophagus clarus]|uniref:F-box domain-containing protein n=1 Tax=Rhizophagus clarus TaxID=94130 RepID=A0A2Z6S3H6_9GLOM|nr:hypothetical protein RclHR1_06210010 [Rhizophagus clarus]